MNESEERAFKSIYRHYFGSHTVTVANAVLPGYGECDILAVSKAGYIYEFEIKDSRSDFLNEMRNKGEKHRKFFAGHGPNYFTFVATDTDMIKIEELPPGFGLIELGSANGWPRVRAKRVHSGKIDLDTMGILANRLTRRAYGFLPDDAARRRYMRR